MRIFFTKRQLQKYTQEQIVFDRHNFMDATARNSAAQAVHSLVCMRTTETWRKLIDEAEKSNDKYISLAQLIVKAGIKK